MSRLCCGVSLLAIVLVGSSAADAGPINWSIYTRLVHSFGTAKATGTNQSGSGAITGSGSLVKSGSTKLTLSGTSSSSGSTTISGGTYSGSGTGGVSVGPINSGPSVKSGSHAFGSGSWGTGSNTIGCGGAWGVDRGSSGTSWAIVNPTTLSTLTSTTNSAQQITTSTCSNVSFAQEYDNVQAVQCMSGSTMTIMQLDHPYCSDLNGGVLRLATPLVDSDPAAKAGILYTGSTTSGLSGGSILNTGTFIPNSLFVLQMTHDTGSLDYDAGSLGEVQLNKTLLAGSPINDGEPQQLESYLNYKWFGTAAAPYINGAWGLSDSTANLWHILPASSTEGTAVSVPEPGTLLLLGTGAFVVVVASWKRRRLGR